MDNPSNIDIFLMLVCNKFLENPRNFRTSNSLESILRQLNYRIPEDSYAELHARIESCGLFLPVDWSNKDGSNMSITFSEDAKNILKRYDNKYIKYISRKNINDSDIIDLFFERMKKVDNSISTREFLKSQNIEYDELLVKRVSKIIESSELVKSEIINTFSEYDALFELNGKGYTELNNLKFSEYLRNKTDNKTSNGMKIYGNVINHGNNSPFQVGHSNKQNVKYINGDNDLIIKAIDNLIETLFSEDKLSPIEKRILIKDLESAQQEFQKGNRIFNYFEKLLNYASNIASIGAFLMTVDPSTNQPLIELIVR